MTAKLKLSIYERTVICQMLAMAEGRISVANYGAFSLRTGRHIASLGKDALSQQGRAFIAKRCRPFMVSELEKQVARKTRNVTRLTRMIHAAADCAKFDSAVALAGKARNHHEALVEMRQNLVRNKTSYYTLSRETRTAYRVYLVASRLAA